jgi:hypothetical protein
MRARYLRVTENDTRLLEQAAALITRMYGPESEHMDSERISTVFERILIGSSEESKTPTVGHGTRCQGHRNDHPPR